MNLPSLLGWNCYLWVSGGQKITPFSDLSTVFSAKHPSIRRSFAFWEHIESLQFELSLTMSTGKLLRSSRNSNHAALAQDKSSNTVMSPTQKSQASRSTKPSFQKSRNRRRPKPATQRDSRFLTNGSNTGFVRFLQKHSSSKHQRVTAGGRIVPMTNQTSQQQGDVSQEDHRPSPVLLNQTVNCGPWQDFELDSDYAKTQFDSLPIHQPTVQNHGQGPLFSFEAPVECHWVPHVPQHLSCFPLPWQSTDQSEVVLGFFSDPGDYQLPLAWYLPVDPGFETPIYALRLQINSAASGYSFRPQGFEKSMYYLILHNSWNVGDLIQLRTDLAQYWTMFTGTIDSINHRIAETDCTHEEHALFRLMYYQMRWNVGMWQHVVGSMIRSQLPLYHDEHDTSASEWGDATNVLHSGSEDDDLSQHHQGEFNGEAGNGCAGVQSFNDVNCKENSEFLDVFRKRVRIVSETLHQSHSSHDKQIDSESAPRLCEQRTSRSNSPTPEKGFVKDEASNSPIKENQDDSTATDKINVTDAEITCSESVITVVSQGAQGENESITTIPSATKLNSWCLSTVLKYMKTHATGLTNSLRNGTPPIGTRDGIEVLYDPSSGASYLQETRSSTQQSAAINTTKTTAEGSANNFQRIHDSLVAVLSRSCHRDRHYSGAPGPGTDDTPMEPSMTGGDANPPCRIIQGKVMLMSVIYTGRKRAAHDD